jgi:signal transduction histidine kinase
MNVVFGQRRAAIAVPPHRGRLFRKYVLVFVLLVCGALITSSLVELYFSYLEQQTALTALQQEKATAAAAEIAHFIDDTRRQVEWTILPTTADQPVSNADRRAEYLRLLNRAPAITDVRYIEPDGRERMHVSRISVNVEDELNDDSHEPAFVQASSGVLYFGPVYFQSESEPYLRIAVPDPGTGGVVAAEVNLKFIWDVVSQIRVGRAGYAYVVDQTGTLVAHPDIGLVLQRTNLSDVPRVAVAQGAQPSANDMPSVLNSPPAMGAGLVLTAHERIDPPGWWVIVDQPLGEAFAPLYASLGRTALLLLVGLALAVVASFILARRMVTPIQALQVGAARVGTGALDQQISVRTGDELEELADEFNRMAAQLRASYAGLEQKVQERTADLANAFQDLAATSRELQIANQHKSEFLANMSHELRTPLNAIIGFSEMLTEGMLGPLEPKQRDYVEDILASGKHLLALINDILDLSKVEAGRMELELSEFSIADLLDYTLGLVRAWSIRQGLTLRLDVEPDLGMIRGDERKINQVMLNLLSNAMRFTPHGGTVTVEARRAADRDAIVVRVRDTGVGIRPEDLPHIFDEFYQAAQKPERAQEGTGLGLALAKKFVELHGGRLWAESEPGLGSTFSFTLPRGAAPAPAPDAPLPAAAVGGV